jgi:hypothetical protein
MKRTRKQRPGGDNYQEFQYNGFTIMVPCSVLKAWEAQGNKQLEMINVMRSHYARTRADWEKAKFEAIREGISCTLEFSPQKGDSPREIARKLENREVKKRVLELLKYQKYRAWHLSPINDLFTRSVVMAALDGDEHFFLELGKQLEKKPIPYKPPRKPSNLAELLLDNWGGTGICFCWFSDNALRDFLGVTGETYTLDAIKKAYARLEPKLPRLKRALVRSVERDGKRILLSGAKPAPRTHKPEWWTHDPKTHLSERELTASYHSHRQVQRKG